MIPKCLSCASIPTEVRGVEMQSKSAFLACGLWLDAFHNKFARPALKRKAMMLISRQNWHFHIVKIVVRTSSSRYLQMLWTHSRIATISTTGLKHVMQFQNTTSIARHWPVKQAHGSRGTAQDGYAGRLSTRAIHSFGCNEQIDKDGP